jgi:hypothetical protein
VVVKEICHFCETEYKLSYEEGRSNGFPKFCPFCSEPVHEGNDQEDED